MRWDPNLPYSPTNTFLRSAASPPLRFPLRSPHAVSTRGPTPTAPPPPRALHTQPSHRPQSPESPPPFPPCDWSISLSVPRLPGPLGEAVALPRPRRCRLRRAESK
ncbi:proline-rich protein 13-like [Prinia subflava]|uniref:proline-rich protein 13-like n=1 Tax=Prinia subflava TaxID=208062 RepID=UPI002FE049EC